MNWRNWKAPVEAGKVRPEVHKAVLELLVTVLSPFAPHIADELWEGLGHAESILRARLASV